MKIKVDPHSATPIYEQMVNTIITAIEANTLGTGDKLPSIRGLSTELGINPNTTARVYRELEIRGFIESKAGSGSYVLPIDEKAAAAVKNARMQQLFKHLQTEAKARQIDEQDFLHFVKLRAST